MKTLENIKPVETYTGKSFGSWSEAGKEVKTAFIRSDGAIICRSDEGDRMAVVDQIAELKRTDRAGKGWKIEQIFEMEHKDGVFTERTYDGEGLDYLFE